MPEVTAKLKGVVKALRKTNQLESILNRIGRRMFGEIGEYMVSSSKKNFSEERTPDGNPYPPLAERTVKAKGHQRMLFQTGALNRGIQVISLSNKKVSVGVSGTEAKKGVTHQFGRERIDNVTFNVPEHKRKAHTRKTKSGKTVKVRASNVRAHIKKGSLPPIPARPFLGFSKPRKDKEKIAKIALRFLSSEARRI